MLELTMKQVRESYGGILPPGAAYRPDDAEIAATTAEASRRDAAKPKRRTRSERFADLNAFTDMGMAELTGAETKVWLILFRDTKANGTARTGQADIAERAGLSDRHVKRAVKSLAKKGRLRIIKRGRLNAGPSTYKVHPTGTT